MTDIEIFAAAENNLKEIDLTISRNKITAITGVSGAGKSSLVLDVILCESQRRFCQTMSLNLRKYMQDLRKPRVRAINNLSPALVLKQAPPPFAANATVGSITLIDELWRVLFASIGERKCPHHLLPTRAQSNKEAQAHLLAKYSGDTLIVAAPLRNTSNHDWNTLKRKYLRVIIDNALYYLDETLPAGKVCDVVVDVIKVKENTSKRLARSIEQSQLISDGYCKIYRYQPEIKLLQYCANKHSCPICSFTWQQLDSNDFARNARGSCPACAKADSSNCKVCAGTGLRKELGAITIAGYSFLQIEEMKIPALKQLVSKIRKTMSLSKELTSICLRLQQELTQLAEVGLAQLAPNRRLHTLSSGQQQRIRIATLISEEMSGVIYIFDEPSQGLATADFAKLWQKFVSLKERNNTVIVVDHHPLLLQKADWVIELGPRGGKHGGRVQAKFMPKNNSVDVPRATNKTVPKNYFVLQDVCIHDLHIPVVKFATQAINVVTGVSASGKSNLIEKCLYRSLLNNKAEHCRALSGANFNTVTFVDRQPLPRRARSLVVTQLGIFSFLRELFGRLRNSQIAGFQAKDFSLQTGNGRCKHCQGLGYMEATVSYLPATPCYLCAGSRYSSEIKHITYKRHNICQVLAMTVEQAKEFFRNFAKINKILRYTEELGLGYLQLGQSLNELSGGEGQRLKLVPYLAKTQQDALLILDEPARGLHPYDVSLLQKTLQKMRDNGATLVLIEHNQQIISNCQWLIELGLDKKGAFLLYEGG